MLNPFKICPTRSVCLVSVLTNIKVAALNTFFIQMLGKEIQFCKSFFFFPVCYKDIKNDSL